MEDHVGPAGDRRCRASRRGEIGGNGLDLAGKALGTPRRFDVEQCQRVDRLIAERLVAHQSHGQLMPDHAGGAGDENVHCLPYVIPNRANRRERGRNP
jgi:hypothetical protein